jgi:hypothetical protein
MSLQRAIFSVTCDVNGEGSADVTLKLPSDLTRHSLLTAVTVDVSAAVKAGVMVTLSQLDVATVATGDTTAETVSLGDQLFFVDLNDAVGNIYPSRASVYEFEPRRSSQVSPIGTAPTSGDAAGQTIIRTKKARCEVHKAGALDVVTVNMYYETAGDYRF